MKNLTISVLFIFAVFISFSWTNPTWEEFLSYDGKFRVLAPGKMKQKVHELETDLGSIQYHSFFYESKEKDADNLVYLLSYCDYPENSVHSDSLTLMQEFFKTTVAAAVESVKGELLYETDVFIDNFAGRYWRVDYNDGEAVIKTKAYLVKNRFYSVQTICLKGKALNLSSNRFLDSFGLL